MEQAAQNDHSLVMAAPHHWPEYLMEGVELGLFMISACLFVALLEYPASLIHQALPDPVLRRVLIGAAMGATAIGIIYSPIGQRSGAHFNPAVTLTFWRLGKISSWDAIFYSFSHFVGGTLGVVLSALLLGMVIVDPTVNYVVTTPGMEGPLIAFIAEVLISFMQMTLVLYLSNSAQLGRFTGVLAGVMLAAYISIEAPYSGMSMNPARTFASALPANLWTAWWVYFTAPPLGMLVAAELYLHRQGIHKVFCAKLHHHNDHRCIFQCKHNELIASSQ